MKSNSDDTAGWPSMTRPRNGTCTVSIDANASSSDTVIVSVSSSCMILLSTDKSLANKGREQMAESRRKKAPALPPHMKFLPPRPMHSFELFLLLLLHRPQQRLGIRVA